MISLEDMKKNKPGIKIYVVLQQTPKFKVNPLHN